MSADRVRADAFLLSQELLGKMLGVRPTVSDTAVKLHTRGVFRYTRGKLRVVDRPALGGLACDCYRILKAEVDERAARR